MKATVIYGQTHRNMTYTMAQTFLKELAADQVDEFFLPKDGPGYCCGYNRCFTEGESKCKDHEVMERITASVDSCDVLVLVSPNYVAEVTGQMKTLFDHYAYRWLSHRPEGSMFRRVGVVISSSAGASTKSVTKSMARQLTWWGVQKTYILGMISHAYTPQNLDPKKRQKMENKAARIARSIKARGGKAPFNLKVRLLFKVFRSMQSGKAAWNETDRKYWEGKGWLDKVKPWK